MALKTVFTSPKESWQTTVHRWWSESPAWQPTWVGPSRRLMRPEASWAYEGGPRYPACGGGMDNVKNSSGSIGESTRAPSDNPRRIRILGRRKAGTGPLPASSAQLLHSLQQAESHPGSRKRLSPVSLSINGAILAHFDLGSERDSHGRSVHLKSFTTYGESIWSANLQALDHDATAQRFVEGGYSPILRSETYTKHAGGASGQPSRGLMCLRHSRLNPPGVLGHGGSLAMGHNALLCESLPLGAANACAEPNCPTQYWRRRR